MDFNFLKRELLKLGLKGYALSRKKIKREGQQGTQFTVTVRKSAKSGTHVNTYKKIICAGIRKLLKPGSL